MPPAPKANAFAQKVGPLPLWGWLVVVGAGVYFWTRQAPKPAAAAQGQTTLPYPTYQDYGAYGTTPQIFVLPSGQGNETGASTTVPTSGPETPTPPPAPPPLPPLPPIPPVPPLPTPSPFVAGSSNPWLASHWAGGQLPTNTIPIYGTPGTPSGAPIVGAIPFGSSVSPTGPAITTPWSGGGTAHLYPVSGGYVSAADISGRAS